MQQNMDFYRDQIFRSASVHGAASADNGLGKTLTPEGLKASQKTLDEDAELQAVLAEAVQKGLVSRDDALLRELVVLFFGDAKTNDGRKRALRMAVGIVHRLRQKFEITEKK